jgi:crossover junction endodeoxyribonuclease RuvC
MRILGIDPGLDQTGYGVIEVSNGSEPRLVEAGLVRSKKGEPLARRLGVIAQQIRTLITQLKPQLMVVEDLYSHYKTPKPAILMGHVRGVILGAAALSDLPVVSYLPTRIKRAVVGQGHAGKERVARLVQIRLRLSDAQVPPDVTDALAAALCHLDSLRKP